MARGDWKRRYVSQLIRVGGLSREAALRSYNELEYIDTEESPEAFADEELYRLRQDGLYEEDEDENDGFNS